MTVLEGFGWALTQHRLKRGWTEEQLAGEVNARLPEGKRISANDIIHYERDLDTPPMDGAKAITDILGFDADDRETFYKSYTCSANLYGRFRALELKKRLARVADEWGITNFLAFDPRSDAELPYRDCCLPPGAFAAGIECIWLMEIHQTTQTLRR